MMIIPFLKVKFKKMKIEFIRTLMNKKAIRDYIKALKETTEQADKIFRANHSGGCPCPDEITKQGFLSFLTENL